MNPSDPQFWYGFVTAWVAAAVLVMAAWGAVTLWRKRMEASV